MRQNCLRIQKRILLQMTVWLWSRLAGNGKWLRTVAILFFDAGLRPLLWSDPIKCWISILHQKTLHAFTEQRHYELELIYEDRAITQQHRAIETKKESSHLYKSYMEDLFQKNSPNPINVGFSGWALKQSWCLWGTNSILNLFLSNDRGHAVLSLTLVLRCRSIWAVSIFELT